MATRAQITQRLRQLRTNRDLVCPGCFYANPDDTGHAPDCEVVALEADWTGQADDAELLTLSARADGDTERARQADRELRRRGLLVP